MLSFMKDEESQENGSQAPTSSEGLSSDEETSQKAQTDGESTKAVGQATQPAGQTTQAAGKTTQTASLSKALSDAGDLEQAPTQDYLVPSSSGKKVKYSTMILGVVFLVGAASLFLMIKKFGPGEASAQPTQDDIKIEKAIAHLTGSKQAINKKMNDIVDRISRLSQVEQVSVDELKKNPFVQDNSFSGIDFSSVGSSDSKYKLWSVMQSGGQKSCMINNRVYQVGDRVGKYSVKSIGTGFVELVAGENKLVLRMSK